MRELFENIGGKPVVVQALCGVELRGCIRLEEPSVLNKPEAKEAMMLGKYSICDSASQGIVTNCLLNAQSPESMLEVCAGRGNKTIMFQSLANEIFGRQLDLTTLDSVEKKTNVLRERGKRYGLNLSRTLTADATSNTAFQRVVGNAKFDVVFVDTPCSGLGTLRRHPELKWRLTTKKINQLASTSFKILSNAAKHVAPGGILTYSTCTVTKAENEEVVERFLNSPQGQKFKLISFKTQDKEFPYYRTITISGLNDAHFSACMRCS